jgi:diacylglycerol O-acyltransferase
MTARRVFATCSLPLAQIKAVRQASGVSVNDVVLGVVAGALRAWLDARGEYPSGPLIAGVPVGTDSGGDVRLGGNRVSNLFTSLCTDIADPLERLHAISRVTAEAKIVQRTLGEDMLADWVQFTPPAPFNAAMRAYSRLRAASWHRPPFNVIVSNVPGPREQVTLGGAALLDLYSVGPILGGIGLNVTAWSYTDRMNFSLLSCPDLLADLRPLADEFAPALDELTRRTEVAT